MPDIQEQKKMEEWFSQVLAEGSRLFERGVVPMLKPGFSACNAEERSCEIEFEVYDWEVNPQSMLNGGILATAFDTAMGLLCVYYSAPRVIITITLDLIYHKPTSIGDKIKIRSKLDFIGGSICSVSAQAWTDKYDVPIASATGVFKKLKEEQHIPLT